MNFFQKIGLGITFAFLPQGEQLKISSGLIPNWQDGKAIEPDTKFSSLVKHGWRRNELIFGCSSKKARTASQVSLRVYKKSTNEEIPDHPLRRLFMSPNPRMSEYDFWSSVFVFQDFAGNAYYEKVRSEAGRTVQLWPMRPDWIRIVPSKETVIGGYWYAPPGVDPVYFDVNDVLSFNLWDPMNMYQGFPPVAVAARTGDVDNSVTDYIRLLFQEGGVPPGLLKTKQSIGDAVAQRVKAIWKENYGGYKNWSEPAVLGNDMEYQQVGLGIENIGMDILDPRSEIRICMVMVVPPTVMQTGIGLERAIMSNAKEYHLNWWTDDLIPMYKNHNDALRPLVAEFGDDIYTAWDFHEVPALQMLTENKRKWALEAWSAGAITTNQFNAEAGLPDAGLGGNVYVRSAVTIEVPAPAPKKTGKTIDLLPSGQKVAANSPDDDTRRLHENEIKDGMTDFLGEEMGRLITATEEAISHRPPKEDGDGDPV